MVLQLILHIKSDGASCVKRERERETPANFYTSVHLYNSFIIVVLKRGLD